MSGQGGGWRVQWTDGTTLKIEQEAESVSDRAMEDWSQWMDSQLEKRFGESRPRLTVSTLNFSRNDLGDDGVRTVVDYLRKRNMGVQMVKFFKNSISDAGAWAIGQLLAHSPEPVQEVHLSHNRITEQGACSILEAIASSHRYPYPSDRMGRRDPRGLMPIWLRMEYNCINWNSIENRLQQRQVRWCTAESRDAWGPKDHAPMVCMHQSYKNQKLDSGATKQMGDKRSKAVPEWASGDPAEPPSLAEMSAATHASRGPQLDGQHLLAALQGDGGAKQTLETQLAQARGERHEYQEDPSEEVPMYVFVDASAVRRMMGEGFLTFQGLLNLCQQGHMKCTPPDDWPKPPWMGPVEERERIIFVVTDSVLDELADLADRPERKRVEWLRNSSDSYLQRCHSWGILEVLETKLHTQLMKLTPTQEQRARDLRISKRAVMMFDFASLWESQIESEGRVLFVTANESVRCFGVEVGREDKLKVGRSVVVLHADDLERWFAADRRHGGQRLCEAALKPKVGGPCGSVLSAAVMLGVVASGMSDGEVKGDGSETELLRKELREAMSLVAEARHVLGGHRSGPDVTRCVCKMNEAHRRWQDILARSAAF